MSGKGKIPSMRIKLELRRITTGHTLKMFRFVVHETTLEIAQKENRESRKGMKVNVLEIFHC